METKSSEEFLSCGANQIISIETDWYMKLFVLFSFVFSDGRFGPIAQIPSFEYVPAVL